MKAAKFFLSEIIWIDIDPMRRKIIMKNVAGFQSFDFTLLGAFGSAGAPRRRGFGIRDFQNDVSATVSGES